MGFAEAKIALQIDARNAADYETSIVDPAGRAMQAVRKARTLLSALERVRAPGQPDRE